MPSSQLSAHRDNRAFLTECPSRLTNGCTIHQSDVQILSFAQRSLLPTFWKMKQYKYLTRHSVPGGILAEEKMCFGLSKMWSIGIFSLFCINSMHKVSVGGFSERTVAVSTRKFLSAFSDIFYFQTLQSR